MTPKPDEPMTSIPSEGLDVEGLRKIAEAATPGFWIAVGLGVLEDKDPGHDASICRCDEYAGKGAANARFIATFDPPTVLRLLSAEEERKRLEVIARDLINRNDTRDSITRRFRAALSTMQEADDGQ